jgi:PAS domain S-box-containing protein
LNDAPGGLVHLYGGDSLRKRGIEDLMRTDVGQAREPTEAERFQLLVDAVVGYAICMIDAEGFVTTWNSGAERIDGYRAVEIIGQHFSRFFTSEERASGLPDKILERTRAEGHCEVEGWRVRKDGSRYWANSTIQAVHDPAGRFVSFANITRDVTEKAAAQEALLESERRFRVLVEGVIDYAIYMLDPSGVVTNWNAGAERLKGYTADEIVGQHFSKFYTKEDRTTGLPARVLDIATREGRCEAEGWRLRKDGSRFWASVVIDAIRANDGSLLGFAKVTRDVTERRAAHEALLESERQFRLLVEGVSDYALFMLDPNGNVISWNSGAKSIKGYDADEIIGQHFSRFYTEQDRAAGIPARALHTAISEGRFAAEGWRVRKSGDLFWASVVIDPIRERGELVGFAKITRDITERRQAQIALEEAQIQRAHAQKMEALGKLTGGVAHDFNNLLMVVSGHIQTLKRSATDPKAARAAEAIELAAQRGSTLTRQLLTFSRRQTFHPTVVSLREHMEGFRNMLANALGETTRLVTSIGPEVWLIKADASELELALVNVTLNARDAMPNGGTIVLTAENVLLRRGDVPEKIEGEFVVLRITDTGRGIAPDVLAKVFDPFFTTKGSAKGSGLGLSQVHGFAHQSGGTVAIQSQLGRGTTVEIFLPRATEGVGPTLDEPQHCSASSGVVLVVEDNPDVSVVSASMLKQLGYVVHTVPNADAALNALAKDNIDLVVSDIVMAGEIDGMALARLLRTRKPDLPVLLVTGYSEAASEAGSEFIVLYKPFQLADLSRMAARLIAEARQPPSSNLVRLRDVRRTLPSKGETK